MDSIQIGRVPQLVGSPSGVRTDDGLYYSENKLLHTALFEDNLLINACFKGMRV